jgi:hypothetical protein
MKPSRAIRIGMLGAASAAALVVTAAAAGQQAPRVPASQAVVTPDDPIAAQQTDPLDRDDEPDLPSPTPFAGRARGGPRPYTQVITSEARTDDGIFKVHRIRDTIYYEIPTGEFGKDFLWSTKLKRTTLGAGYGGQAVNDRVVRWVRRGDRVYLEMIRFDITADPSTPIARAVADANTPTIVRAFPIAAISPIGSVVVDVTSLLTRGVPELSPERLLGGSGVDPSRTFIDKVVSFPQNINAEVTQTITPGRGEGRGRGLLGASGGTVVVFSSMVKLPETPMKPRLFDDRVGYFATSTYDYGRTEHKAVSRSYILRRRLEKKDPHAALSDPVTPIVYYIDPATPAELVPWIKKGVEDWAPAFQAAGFTHAIVAKDAPSEADDPDWDPEDVRYSVIRWLPSTTENASGPNVHDPRSGEILDGDVQLYHNVQHLATMWYFTQVGPLDPRARTLPLPDDLVGRLLEFIVAQVVGHTLGFQHNMKASSLYSIAEIRDKDWVKTNGHTPSIMDYARFNYVAQPEDGIAPDDLIPKVGPSDVFATKWGYTPLPDAKTPDAEKATLDEWAREQDAKPYLRFTTANSFGADPGEETEAVGDIDATSATALGLRNLRKVADMLIPATTRDGVSYEDLGEAYSRLVAQWRVEMGHVANVIGGVDSKELYGGQDGLRFTPVPKTRQSMAVQFLLQNALETPTFLINPDLLRRIEPSGVVSRLHRAQLSLLNAMLQPSRLDRMVEQGAMDPAAYTLVQYLADLREGIWHELRTPAKPIDIYRRNVQRAYLATIDNRLHGRVVPSDEVRALLKGELRAVDLQVRRALPLVADTGTRRHLQDARDEIAAILDPRAMRTSPIPSRGAGPVDDDTIAASDRSSTTADGYDFDNDPFLQAPDGCWVDLTVK